MDNDFLNIGDFISYPLETSDYVLSSSSSLEGLPRRGLSDAGFILGQDVEFDPETQVVYLHGVEITSTDVIFDFRCSSPDADGYRWRFVCNISDIFVRGLSTVAEKISNGNPYPGIGCAWINPGDLSELAALPVGAYALEQRAPLEPSRIQSVRNTFARSVNLANGLRACPLECCGSESSLSSGIQTVEPAYVAAIGLVGHVKFKEGWNAKITVEERDNSITIAGELKAGEGLPCEDIIVDPTGMYSSSAPCGDNQGCDGFIRSINGVQILGGDFPFLPGPGLAISSDPSWPNRLNVIPDVNRLCEGSL